MNPNIGKTTMRALIVAGRFGFISRDIFWQHILGLKKSENYVNWAKLRASDYFKTYPGLERYLYVSRAGIQALLDRNEVYVGRANPIYFVHDQLVMSAALACENDKLIRPHWACDAVIRKLSNMEIVRLLGATADKIPDLVFDLNVRGGQSRGALEVERSRKSTARYDALVLSYMEMRSVNLVIIAYSDKYIEKQIRNSMKRLGYPQSIRPMAFCKIADLIEHPSSFPVQINSNAIAFDKFVSNLRRLEGAFEPGESSLWPEKIQESIPENGPAKRSA